MSQSIASQSVGGLLEAIAARTPTPGGGAVAGLTAALAAAIGHMALIYSVRKDTPEAVRSELQRALGDLKPLMVDMLERCDQDARAYAEVNRLQRLPENDPDRQAKWTAAVNDAIAAPLAVMRGGCSVLDAVAATAEHCSPWLVSDLAVAAILAEAGVRAAGLNVNINLPLVSEPGERDRLLHEMRRFLERARQVLDGTGRILRIDPAAVAAV